MALVMKSLLNLSLIFIGLRLKPDKWARMVVSDEQRTFISAFIDRNYPQELVISQNFSGHLVAHTDWPSILRNKGVFFVKREPEPLPKDNFMSFMTCGDIHPNALDHFCAWVEEVIAPILKLEKNLDKFPQCIADDIKRQVHELSTSVYQIRGYIKGRTLLPFPQVDNFIAPILASRTPNRNFVLWLQTNPRFGLVVRV